MIICDSCSVRSSVTFLVEDCSLTFYTNTEGVDDEFIDDEDEEPLNKSNLVYNMQLCPSCRSKLMGDIRSVVDSTLGIKGGHPEVAEGDESAGGHVSSGEF